MSVKFTICSDNEMDKHSQNYDAIISFYDLAEKLLDSVEHPDVKDPVSQLDFIEPIVIQLEASADLLSKEYRNFVATGKIPNFLARKRIVNAIRTINVVLIEYNQTTKVATELSHVLEEILYNALENTLLRVVAAGHAMEANIEPIANIRPGVYYLNNRYYWDIA